MKHNYDKRNVNFTQEQYDKFRQTQDEAKTKLRRFISLGDIIVALTDNDPVICRIYNQINNKPQQQ